MKISHHVRKEILRFNAHHQDELNITYNPDTVNFTLSVSGAKNDWIPFIVFDATDLYYKLDDQYMNQGEFLEFVDFYKLIVDEDIWIGKEAE